LEYKCKTNNKDIILEGEKLKQEILKVAPNLIKSVYVCDYSCLSKHLGKELWPLLIDTKEDAIKHNNKLLEVLAPAVSELEKKFGEQPCNDNELYKYLNSLQEKFECCKQNANKKKIVELFKARKRFNNERDEKLSGNDNNNQESTKEEEDENI
jgi:hypothetical protein